uniref:Uncharacterized protein n=1 Tax=Anopheles merus TaxID=30066 RepID=A0A182V0I5_ANOME
MSLTSQYDDHAQAEYDAEVLMGTSSHNSDTDYISDRSSESETDAVAEGSTTAHNCNNHSDIGSNKDDAEMMLDEDVGGRKSFTGVFTKIREK